jgi:hypothetical protein
MINKQYCCIRVFSKSFMKSLYTVSISIGVNSLLFEECGQNDLFETDFIAGATNDEGKNDNLGNLGKIGRNILVFLRSFNVVRK